MITTSEKKPAPSFTAVQAQHSSDCCHGKTCAPTHEEIAQSAYNIYVATGWVQGQSAQNWMEAERLLRSQSQEVARQEQQHAPEPLAPFIEASSPASAPRRRG